MKLLKEDLKKLVAKYGFLEKVCLEQYDEIIYIIHRGIKEINSKDYKSTDINRFLKRLNEEKINFNIVNNHFYVAKYSGKIIGVGGVGKDENQESQSYLMSVFINPDYEGVVLGRKIVNCLEKDEWCIKSKIIEVSASKSAHTFYHKLGYKYYDNPLIFKEDGSTIMYKVQ